MPDAGDGIKKEREGERYGMDIWTCSNSSSFGVRYSRTCMHCCLQGLVHSGLTEETRTYGKGARSYEKDRKRRTPDNA